ncbi:30S ribosomal protein S11 [Thermocrinis sp.]
MARKKQTAKAVKKQKRTVTQGIVHILSTFNNTIVNITDLQGNTLVWESGGTVGFKGTRKSTPYAAQLAAQKAVKRAMQEYGLQEAEVIIKGAGAGRESALKAVHASGLKITKMRDTTPIPHNGCRAPSRRRV